MGAVNSNSGPGDFRAHGQKTHPETSLWNGQLWEFNYASPWARVREYNVRRLPHCRRTASVTSGRFSPAKQTFHNPTERIPSRVNQSFAQGARTGRRVRRTDYLEPRSSLVPPSKHSCCAAISTEVLGGSRHAALRAVEFRDHAGINS